MLIGGPEFTKFDAILIALGFLMICCMVALWSSIKYFAFLCFMMFFTFLACVFFTWLAHVDNATGPFYFFCVLSVLTGALVTWMIRDCYGMYKFEKTRPKWGKR